MKKTKMKKINQKSVTELQQDIAHKAGGVGSKHLRALETTLRNKPIKTEA